MEKLKNTEEELLLQKTELQKKLYELDESILNLQFKIMEKCSELGHDYVTERELCIYGEEYTYCRRCNIGN